MASKARDLSNFISVATIDASEIASNAITADKIADVAVTHAKLHTDMNLSGKTLTFATNQISGNSIDGGVISNFASTGIDDNASSTAVTILSSGNVGIGTTNPGVSRLYLRDTHTTAVTNAATMLANTTLTINGNSGQGSDVIRMGPMGTAGRQFIDVSNSAGNAAYDLLLNPISGGKVGIGTDSPVYKLHVNSGATNIVADFESTDGIAGIRLRDNSGNVELSASGNDFRVQPAGSTPAFVVKNGGNVGIGTDSPEADLQIATSSNAAAGGAKLLLKPNGAYGTIVNNDDLGQIAFGAKTASIDNTDNDSVMIRGVADGTWASNDYPTRLEFWTTTDGVANPTERMRIDASGNVSTPNTVFAPQYNRGTVASSAPMGTLIFHDNEVSNVNRSISNGQTTWTDALSKVVTPQSANSYFWVEFYSNEHINTQTPNYCGGMRLIGDTGGVDTEIARGGEMKYRSVASTIPPYNGNAKTWGSWYNPTTASNITFRAQVTGSSAQSGGNNYYYHWASSYIANQRGPRLRIVEFT